jgi:predicted GNAT family acetyltransferase
MVSDDSAHRRFVVDDTDGRAHLLYARQPGRLILVHTEVPDDLGGRGLGGELVRAAVDEARAEQLTLVPWCPFARRWLQQHPDVAGTVTIDWKTPPPRTSDPGSGAS